MRLPCETTIKSPFKDLERTFKAFERTFRAFERTFKAFERTLQSTERNFICGSQILVVWFNDFC